MLLILNRSNIRNNKNITKVSDFSVLFYDVIICFAAFQVEGTDLTTYLHMMMVDSTLGGSGDHHHHSRRTGDTDTEEMDPHLMVPHTTDRHMIDRPMMTMIEEDMVPQGQYIMLFRLYT